MDCLKIDWENVDRTFERDEFYESIQAPKWIDFTVPLQPADDHAWFCGKTGCTHKSKTVLQAINQKNMAPFEASMVSADKVDPLMAKAPSASIAAKKARAVLSSSLSSFSDIKAAFSKNKVLHHTQMPSIGESKGKPIKNNGQQASENENPNRACKVQDGACKKHTLSALEGMEKKDRLIGGKRIVGKEGPAHAKNRNASMHIIKTGRSILSEQLKLSLSEMGPVLEGIKPVFIFGKRDPLHANSILDKGVGKDSTSDLRRSITEAKNKRGGVRPFLRQAPTTRNPYLSASLAMPIIRRSAANARPLHGVCLGKDKVAECKPPRATKDVRVSVQVCSWRKKNEHKLQERDPPQERELQEEHTTLLVEKQEPSPSLLVQNGLEIGSKDSNGIATSRDGLHTQERNEQISHVEGEQGVLMESRADNFVQESTIKSSDIETREKEDSISNTLEEFLENLQISSHEDDSVPNEDNCESKQKTIPGDCPTEQNVSEVPSVKNQRMVVDSVLNEDNCESKQNTIPGDCATEQNVSEVSGVKNQWMVVTHDVEYAIEQDAIQTHHVDDEVMEHEGVISHQSDELSGMCKPLCSKYESKLLSTALHMRCNSGTSAKGKVIPTENDKGRQQTQQKINVQSTKDWQRHRGTKRKSSELNLNVTSKDQKHETQKVKLSSSTAKPPDSRLQDACEEQHKKMRTTRQAFKPFRFRTEERGALKGLGLGQKESGVPNPKEPVHHALRMPSFGHPFQPQRSTKKLTIPREPKFHVSRTKNPCTSTRVATTSTCLASL